jgi:hypothetical protein
MLDRDTATKKTPRPQETQVCLTKVLVSQFAYSEDFSSGIRAVENYVSHRVVLIETREHSQIRRYMNSSAVS